MGKPETYQYSPLLTKNSIRLLLLQPGAPGSDIHCSLIHSTLRDLHDDIYQHYISLSYVWGDASKKRTVFVDHTPFQATVNLAAALEDLRHPQMVLRLWADAICINQSNTLERNHQVGLMRDIYSLAQHTVIHLGERKEECDEVLNAALRGTLNSPHRQLAIDQVLSRPWFTRVWIYQELVLSKDPWVQCGRTRIRWDALYAAICPGEDPRSSGVDGDSDGDPEHDLIRGSGDNDPIHSDVVVDERGLIQLFSDMHKARKGQPETPTLFEIMLSRRGFGVSDPRDLVYGHLAVARLPSKKNFPPCPVVDYERSIAEVFTEATTYILKRAKYDETLQFNHVRTSCRRQKGLPSWVPDWSLPVSQYLNPFPKYVRVGGLNSILSSRRFHPYFPSPTVCRLRCVKLGIVESVNLVDMPHHFPFIKREWRTWHQKWNEIKYVDPAVRWRPPYDPFSPYISMYREVYQEIRELLGQDFFPPLPEQDEELWEHHEFERLMYDGNDEGDDSIDDSSSHLYVSLEYILMKRALKPEESSPWLTGRRIATFSTHELSIVSPEIRPGDEIHIYYDYNGLQLLVLRPCCISSLVLSHPDYEIKRDNEGENWGNVRHFKLVGFTWMGNSNFVGDIIILEKHSVYNCYSSEDVSLRTSAWIH